MRFPRISPDKARNRAEAAPNEAAEPMQPGEDDAFMLAQAIHEAGISAPALFAVSALKPLHWIGGQAVWMLQPFIESLGLLSRKGSQADNTRRIPAPANVALLLEREGGLAELEVHLHSLRGDSAAAGIDRDAQMDGA